MNDDPSSEVQRQSNGGCNKQHWLIAVKHEEEQTAQEIIKTLVADEKIYAFHEYAPERKCIKPGDLICFEVGKDVVAHAEVESGPVYRLHYKVEDPVSYPWVITVKNVHLYFDDPVKFDLAHLDFRPNPRQCVFNYGLVSAWRLTEHDFRLLTKSSKQTL